MENKLIEQIATWNYVRDNRKYYKKLEAEMLYEELEEYLSSEEGTANELKELADIIFVAVGTMYKITGRASVVEEVIQAVINNNNLKPADKDEKGKVIKKMSIPKAEYEIDTILYRVAAQKEFNFDGGDD